MEKKPEKYNKVESLFSQVIEEVPTLPFVVMRLLEVTESDTSSADDIRKIIESDHSLAAKILKLANSPFYAKPGCISNIRDAIVLMGFDAVKKMALTLSVKGLFDDKKNETRFDLQSFWLHSLACALCARDIGKHIKAPFAEEALVCGMLHDIGKALLNQYLPEEYRRVIECVSSRRIGIGEAEDSILGVDHAVVGSWLLKEWEFPRLLSDAVLFHHRFSEKTLRKDPSFKLAALVNLSNNIVHIHRIGSGGDEIPRCINETIMNCLGLTEDDVDKIAAGLHEKIWETANSMGFLVERKTYLEILEKSNQELQESEERYRILSETPIDSSFLMSDVIHDCDEQACRLLGCERDDILGHSLSDFSPPTQPDGQSSEELLREKMDLVLAKKPQSFYWQCQRKDGVTIDIRVSLDAKTVGDQLMSEATIRVLPELKRADEKLKEAQTRFRAIFEKAGGAIFITDTETGEILDCNEQAEKLIGRTRREIIGMHQSELHPQGKDKRYKERLDLLSEQGHVVDLEEELQHKDGRKIPVWISAQAAKMNDKNVIIGIFIDRALYAFSNRGNLSNSGI